MLASPSSESSGSQAAETFGRACLREVQQPELKTGRVERRLQFHGGSQFHHCVFVVAALGQLGTEQIPQLGVQGIVADSSLQSCEIGHRVHPWWSASVKLPAMPS